MATATVLEAAATRDKTVQERYKQLCSDIRSTDEISFSRLLPLEGLERQSIEGAGALCRFVEMADGRALA